MADGNQLDGLSKLTVLREPLQLPGRDRKIRTVEYGGPDCGVDTRLYVDGAMLDRLTAVSRASATGRAVVHGAGVRVDLYETSTGHRYEVWKLVGSHVVAEESPLSGGLRIG